MRLFDTVTPHGTDRRAPLSEGDDQPSIDGCVPCWPTFIHETGRKQLRCVINEINGAQ